jgi:hypothetical protein
MDHLVEILHHPDFSIDCLPKHLNAAWENRKRDQQEEKSPHQSLKGFQETTVKVEVPSGDKNIRSRFVDVPGLHFRKLTTIIQDAFKSPLASRFHYLPFKLFHKCPNSGEEQRVFSELYNSDAFLKEHDSVQRAPVPPDDPGCKREKVVAALMFWSDSTHLTNFGMAKLWPIYMFLGNLSKYIRAETSSQACYHVAYIPSLPDSFQDILRRVFSLIAAESLCTPFGAFSSTMIFFMPISMASLSNAKMVWSVEFILAYSHTHQITQRSK